MANISSYLSTLRGTNDGKTIRNAIADITEAVNTDNNSVITLLSDLSPTAIAAAAVTATTKAGEAAGSADDAADSEVAAAAAKTAAQLAETNAKTSETNSKASETASKASETASAGSAATATTKANESAASAAAALASEQAAALRKSETQAIKDAAVLALAETTDEAEVIEARKGKDSLGEKISEIDSQLADNTAQIADIRSRDKSPKEYGVRIYDNQSSTTLERILDSVGMVANAAVGTGSVVNDFDTADGWPRRRTVNAYYDETAKKMIVTAVKGEPNFKTDGTNGNVWVETERFYVKRTVGTGYIDWSICKEQLPGYYTFPKFKGLDNEELEFGYAAAYEVGTDGSGNPTSISGVNPTNVSHDSGLTLARKLGTRYHMDDTPDIELVRLMMMIEFAKTDSQASIGNGIMGLSNERTTCLATVAETAVNRVILANAEADLYVVGQTIVVGSTLGGTNIANLRKVTSISVYDASNKALNFDGAAVNIAVGNFVTSRMTRTGETDTIIASSGTLVNDGKHAVIYRGTENPFGNGFKSVSDVVFKNEDSQIYICRDPRKRVVGMSALTADYKPIGYTLATTEGYVTALGYDPNYPSARMATVVGGSTATYLADYLYRIATGTAGLKSVFNGGFFANGNRNGCSVFDLGGGLANSWRTLTGRLSFTG